jgi:type IV pilus assembly protein PilC
MKEFRYKALTISGEMVTGIRRAPSVGVLSEGLYEQNLILVDSQRTLGSLGRLFSPAGRIRRQELRDFTLHLATCLSAGVSLTVALHDFEQGSSGGVFKNIVADIRGEINSGAQITKALSKYPDVFSDTYIAVVSAGQSSGDLGKTFFNLVDHLEWLDNLMGQTKQALVYPTLVVTGIVGLFLLMLLYVLPRFMDIFKVQGFHLPAMTLFFMAAFDWLMIWWPFILGGIVAVISGFHILRRNERGQYLIDVFLLRLPVVGSFIKKLSLSRFARYFSLLIGAGTDLLRTLDLLTRVMGNSVLEKDIKKIRDRVMTGETLAASFAQSPNFPPLIKRLVGVGENTGQLDSTLLKATEYLDREIPQALKRAFTILDALIVTILGGLIAIAAISILLPILQMRGQV